jgi:periplasmic divalent cation tolerance protein
MNEEAPGQKLFCMVLTTVPSESLSEVLALQIVAAGLGACVQVQPIKSFYLWKGEACAEPEWRLCIKTRRALYARLESFIHAHHPYEVPQIVQVLIEEGAADYLDWVAAMTTG